MELTTDDINSDGEVSVFVVVEQILMVANPDAIYVCELTDMSLSVLF